MNMHCKRIRLLTASIVFVTIASGCSVSEKTCLQNEWQTLGYQHGEDGKSADTLNLYVKGCAVHSVTPDASEYSIGYKAGILLYCTSENGVKVGRSGKNYSGACPAKLEKTFLENYVTGLRFAMDELENEYIWDSLELDRLRTNRAVFATANEYRFVDDGRIALILGRMSHNTNQRFFINSNIREWSGRI